MNSATDGRASHPAHVRVELLGGFRLVVGADPVSLPRTSERVTAFVALNHNPLLRRFAAGTLWMDASEDRAIGNLRTALWRLRRCGLPVVESTTTHLRLAASVEVDVDEQMWVAQEILQHSTRSDTADFGRLVNLDELLPGWYEDWVIVKREQLRQLRLHALERLCEQLTGAGSLSQAVQVGLYAVISEPLRESARRVLIRAYLAEGNRAEALRQFTEYREQLRDDLGADPSPQMLDLVRDLWR